MEQRRSCDRKQLNQTIEITDVINQCKLGELVNLSIGGMMIMCDRELEINSIFQLSMALPAPINGVTELEVGVDCLWCRHVDNFNRFWAGFQIIDASEETLACIQELLNVYAID
jgi:hypothetical protein